MKVLVNDKQYISDWLTLFSTVEIPVVIYCSHLFAELLTVLLYNKCYADKGASQEEGT